MSAINVPMGRCVSVELELLAFDTELELVVETVVEELESVVEELESEDVLELHPIGTILSESGSSVFLLPPPPMVTENV